MQVHLPAWAVRRNIWRRETMNQIVERNNIMLEAIRAVAKPPFNSPNHERCRPPSKAWSLRDRDICVAGQMSTRTHFAQTSKRPNACKCLPSIQGSESRLFPQASQAHPYP
jgi:hypothetical protein